MQHPAAPRCYSRRGGGRMAATFEEFVVARGEALLRFALMLCGNRHGAEDLVAAALQPRGTGAGSRGRRGARRRVGVRQPGRGLGPAGPAPVPAARGACAAVLRGPRRRRDRNDPGLCPGDRAFPGGPRPCDAAPGITSDGQGGVAVTDVDVETVVRDAFRSHEHLVAGGATGLLDAVRGRVQRRRRTFAVAASGLATLAVLAGAVWLATPHGSGGAAEPPLVSPAAPRRSSVPAPPGWRLESSLGVELTVPAGWETNDFGCGMTAKPSVVRGRGAETQCLTPEPLSKELAVIEQPVGPPFLAVAGRPTSVDGVEASRADGRTGDGRYAGWILIESVHVRVEVRTRDAATTRTILGSVHLVDIDHVGCPTGRPRVARVADSGGGFVTREPAAISICYYGGRATYPLQSPAQAETPTRRRARACRRPLRSRMRCSWSGPPTGG